MRGSSRAAAASRCSWWAPLGGSSFAGRVASGSSRFRGRAAPRSGRGSPRSPPACFGVALPSIRHLSPDFYRRPPCRSGSAPSHRRRLRTRSRSRSNGRRIQPRPPPRLGQLQSGMWSREHRIHGLRRLRRAKLLPLSRARRIPLWTPPGRTYRCQVRLAQTRRFALRISLRPGRPARPRMSQRSQARPSSRPRPARPPRRRTDRPRLRPPRLRRPLRRPKSRPPPRHPGRPAVGVTPGQPWRPGPGFTSNRGCPSGRP
jgi:hypothetical protein